MMHATTQRNQKGHYVDNKVFLQAMTEYWHECENARQEAAKKGVELDKTEMPPTSNYIGSCILAIATNYAKNPNFKFYPFVEEMVLDAVENCYNYIHNWNPEKGNNPFAYFTQICYYAFLRRIEKEKKQAKIKYDAIKMADERGTFEQWYKRSGHESESGDALADYLKISVSDLGNKKGKKKKSKSKGKISQLEDKAQKKGGKDAD
jgi:hypothetical protein